MTAAVEVVPQSFTPYGYGTDPGVGAGRPPTPLPPLHTPTSSYVTQGEFDALEARVTALEATP